MKTKSLLPLITLAVAFLTMMAGAHAASIKGAVFFDFNGNGARDAVSEYGLPTWSVRLEPLIPPGPPVDLATDVNGRYGFLSLGAGTYKVSAVNPSPWVQTHPGGPGFYTIVLATAATDVTGQDFGCKQPVFTPQIQWQRSYGGIGSDITASIQQTPDGGYVIAASSTSIASGVKTSPNYGAYDYWIVRLDASGSPLWDRAFGGSGNDFLHTIRQTSDGGYLLAGVSASAAGGNKTSANYGGNDIWVVKLDASGGKLWETALGGTASEGMRGGNITALQNGGYLVAGFSPSAISASSAEGNKTAPNYGGQDGWLVWLDANGGKYRDLTYGGAGLDQLVSTQEKPDLTILVAGHSNSPATSGFGGTKTSPYWGGNVDYWHFKINADGSVAWDQSWGGGGTDASSGLAGLPDGNSVLTGYSGGSGVSGNKTAPDQNGVENFWVVKVDGNGNEIWQETYGGTVQDEMSNATVTTDGNLLLAGGGYSGIGGNKVSPAFGNWDSWVMLTDPVGAPIWDLQFGGLNDDWSCVAAATQDGGAILMRQSTAPTNGGNTLGTQYGSADVTVIKLAPVACTSNPLALVSGTADCAHGKITVNFSAPVDPSLALQTANYTVGGGPVSVVAASFGASTLTVVLSVTGLAPGVTYTVSVAGLADDCGNVIAANSQITVTCPGAISGRVFADLNGNCLKDLTTEYYLANRPIQLLPGPRYALTDAGGNYSFEVAGGTYTVSALPNGSGNFTRTCPAGAGTYTVALVDGGVVGGNDFAFAPVGTLCADLWVDITADYPGPKLYHIVGNSSPCCGSNFFYRLTYGNKGNALVPVTTGSFPKPAIWFNNFSLASLNALVSTASSPPVVMQAGWPWASGQPKFTLPALPPGAQGTIDLEVHLDCNITEPCATQITLKVQATIFPNTIGECFPANNLAKHWVVPCCSSDPNDCTVTPKGCGPEGFIHRDQDLTYLVRFQNLGGGPAHLVVIKDVLDADLDMSTLEILGSSHPNFMEINGRELRWIFPNIELAPVSLDEKASHGYVKFRIRPRADAPVGTVITNNAVIVFDVNEPLTTITATNTITENPVPVAAFTTAPQAGTAGLIHDFTYTGGTPGAQYEWDFGPSAVPQTSTDLNPMGVIFTVRGPHLVGLVVKLGDCESEPAIHVVMAGLPQLNIEKADTGIALSWEGSGLELQETDSLSDPVLWQTVLLPPTIVGDWFYVIDPNASMATKKFYRLATP